MRKIISGLSISSMILLASCTAPAQPSVEVPKAAVQYKQEVQKPLLQDIYTYEFDKIEPQHQKLIDEWLQESRADNKKNQVYCFSIGVEEDANDGYKYMYVFGKGYRTFETAFMYSQDNQLNSNDTKAQRETSQITDEGKGTVYFKGVKGDPTDETLLRIHYNTKYVSATGLVDKFFK